jgi:hypothetical protein
MGVNNVSQPKEATPSRHGEQGTTSQRWESLFELGVGSLTHPRLDASTSEHPFSEGD